MTPATHSTLFPHGTGSSPYSAPPSGADAVLEGLDPEQREVATALRGPVCVLAGAGTGKTRAITHRIAYGVRAGILQPSTVLAVTFTNRAAGEMRGRLRQLGAAGVQARTFHSAALRQLQYFWPKAVGGSMPRLVDRKIKLVADAAAACRIRLDRGELRDATAEIEWSKVTQTVPADYAAAAAKAGRDAPRDPAEIAQLYSVYEDLKRDRAVIDFEDVLLLTVAILQDRHDIAEQVRAQYQHFVVDEYQDVSPLQQRLLELWLGERDNLCVVGDASQTIYSFTGATPDHLLDFRTRHPGATVVKLVRDYRSTPQVVHLANGLLAQARGRAADHRLELISQRPAGPEPVYTEYTDEPAEAEGAARRIRDLIDRRRPGQRDRHPVPHELPVRDLRTGPRRRRSPLPAARRRAVLRPPRGTQGRRRPARRGPLRRQRLPPRRRRRPALPGARRPLRRGLDTSAPSRLRRRPRTLGVPGRPGATSPQDFAAAKPEATLGDLVAELDERANAQHAPTVQGVTLASLHSAKGLEWDVVFLVGVAEGMMPITYAKTDEQIEEERRLLYVGVTRAREHLHVSWALSRSPGGRPNRRPSRFLDGLRPGSTAHRGPNRGRRARRSRARLHPSTPDAVPRRTQRTPARCRVCGRTLTDAGEMKLMRCEDCPSDMDEGLYERLREWRAVQAQRSGQPAFCVFTDKTLMAIAEAVPDDDGELARIPGVGVRKLNRYGADVLAICAGQELRRRATRATDSNSSKK